MIHRKKNRPGLQRRDILTVSLVSVVVDLFNPVFSGSVLFHFSYSSQGFFVGLLLLRFSFWFCSF